MPIGKTPVNQLNALPLQDADANAAGGDIQVVGGTITRYFSPTVLGISAATAQTINTKVCVFTGFLDLRGCNKYLFNLRRNTPGGAIAALPACTLGIQTRLSSSDAPSVSYVTGATIRDDFNGITIVSSATYIFPATTGAGELQTAKWAWESGSPTVGGNIANAVAIGSDCRFIISWSTNPVAATNEFTASLWASG